MPLITCKDVTFSYDNREIVSGLNFSIRRGDYLCVVGENGAGKTTLIKGLLRLKLPSAGSITLSDGLCPNQIGYMPQQTAVQQDFPASVYEVALSGRLNSRGIRPFYTREDHNAARENIRHMGLSGMERAAYRTLSGGQQRRVLLARALCATHTMLLLDEPAAGLDPAATAELYQRIREINKQLCITIVMVSHDIRSAIENASHILHLHNRQQFYGTSEAYRQSHVATTLLGEKHA